MKEKILFVDDDGRIVNPYVQKKKLYYKPECKLHGRIYVHKSRETGKFRCVKCNKEV